MSLRSPTHRESPAWSIQVQKDYPLHNPRYPLYLIKYEIKFSDNFIISNLHVKYFIIYISNNILYIR